MPAQMIRNAAAAAALLLAWPAAAQQAPAADPHHPADAATSAPAGAAQPAPQAGTPAAPRPGPGGMMGMMTGHGVWSINGVSATGHVHEPLLHLKRGRIYVLALANDTAWHHPIHLHGHSFRVLARNGQPTRFREWRDTVFMAPRERVDIAFVADNPGDWMIHCHILEHQAGGMMGLFRVG